MKQFVKNFYSNLIITSVLLSVFTTAIADDFQIDGLSFDILSEEERTVEVASPERMGLLKGVVIVPETVEYNNKTYTVVSIGHLAFWSEEYVTEFILPNSLLTIGPQSFINCKRITSITLPESVIKIETNAFEKCESLKTVTLSENLREIGQEAFRGCVSLESIYIPASVTDIGYEPFMGTYSMTWIEVSPDNPNYASYDGVLYDKDLGALQSCPGGKETVKLPESLWFFDPGFLSECRSLKEFIVPEDFYLQVYDGALYNSDYTVLLKCPGGRDEIKLHENLEVISAFSFAGCHLLKSIDLPDIPTIPYCAFRDCLSLTELQIPETVSSIGSYAFYNCTSLLNLEIPDAVNSIGLMAFEQCFSLQHIKLPKNLDKIEDRLFVYCTSLLEIDIPKGVTSIGNFAFWWCQSLEKVKIPNTVTFIDDMAFNTCSSLKEIVLPSSLTYLGNDAFVNDRLKSVVCLAKKVPELGSDCFAYIECPLYVYESVLEDYKNSDWAQNFTEILPLNETLYPEDEDNGGIESLFANPDLKISIFTTAGNLLKSDCGKDELKKLPKGIYIVVSGKDRFKIII